MLKQPVTAFCAPREKKSCDVTRSLEGFYDIYVVFTAVLRNFDNILSVK